jgi:hypothetical protein
MTTLGQYFKLRDDTCIEFVEQLKDLIRVQTFHELSQEGLEQVFKMNEQKAILPLASDRLRTLNELSDLEIRETADPNFVNYCYRGVFFRYPKNQAITIQDISASIDSENTQVEVFYSTGEGSTDLSIISGNVEILIGKNEWYLYVAREIWNAFSDNYLESKLASSYKEEE